VELEGSENTCTNRLEHDHSWEVERCSIARSDSEGAETIGRLIKGKKVKFCLCTR
jgi:hypothetical protein